MAGYLPPGSPVFPQSSPHSTWSVQYVVSQTPFWQLSPTPTGNNTSSPGAMIGIAIGFVAFFVLLILLCRYRNSRANAAAHAAAAAPALAARPRAPPQPDYWANDEHRHRSGRDDDGGHTERASPTTAVLPSAFTYNPGVRHNVTGSGDEAACSVCLGAFQVGATVRLLPVCLHLYHVECIDPWLEAHSTCPICRSGTDDDPTMHGGLPPV